MKLRTKGIDHLNLEVANLDETIRFYNNLFGFEIRKEQPEQNSKIIGNDDVKLCLYETNGFKYEKKGFHHFGLYVENFEEAVDKCNELGIKINYGGPVKWEHSSSIYIVDPNGYEIELTEVSGGGI